MYIKDGNKLIQSKEPMPQEVMDCWEGFWKDICTDEEGFINLDQIKRELFDYHFLIQEVPKVYSYITNGCLSYPNYSSDTVLSIFGDHYIDKKTTKDDILGILSEYICCKCGRRLDKEFIEEIEEYFE